MHIFHTLTDKGVIASLRAGGIGVIPTDTVYGLVGSAKDEGAVARMFTVKARKNQPGTVLAASVEQLAELGIKPRYLRAVEQYWPNPISIIIPCGQELAYLHMGKNSLAVRIPANEDLIALLSQTGPLMTTSANHPGEPTAPDITAAEDYFGELADFYVDAGDLGKRLPSTIIRIVDDAIEVIRQGAVYIDESGRVVNER